MAVAIGFFGAKILAETFTLDTHHHSHNRYGLDIIDNDTPIPNHAKFKWSHLIGFLVVGVALGLFSGYQHAG